MIEAEGKELKKLDRGYYIINHENISNSLILQFYIILFLF